MNLKTEEKCIGGWIKFHIQIHVWVTFKYKVCNIYKPEDYTATAVAMCVQNLNPNLSYLDKWTGLFPLKQVKIKRSQILANFLIFQSVIIIRVLDIDTI